MNIRHAEPADHARVAAVIDDWWGGRRVRDMLPRLFFTHFRATSFVAEDAGYHGSGESWVLLARAL